METVSTILDWRRRERVTTLTQEHLAEIIKVMEARSRQHRVGGAVGEAQGREQRLALEVIEYLKPFQRRGVGDVMVASVVRT